MRAVIFARGKNSEDQVAYCRAYAERKGYKVVGVIVGEGRELPEIVRENGEHIDLVIVRDMARISRNALEGYTIQADLEIESGVLVEIAKDDFEEAAEARFMRNLLLAIRDNDARMRVRSAYGRAIRND